MKKTLHIIAFAAVALAALSSCAKEELNENAIPAGEAVEVSINGQIGEFTPADATKATAESVVRVTWGSGDNVFVYDGSDASIGTLTVTPDDNNASYAMLSGTITASAASPSKLTLVYVKGATEAPAIAGGKISVDLSSQNQTEVPFVLYTTVAYDAAALTKTNEYISFSFATSVMTVNCTGLQTGDSGAVSGIDKAEIDGVSTACELTIDGSGVTAVAGTTLGTITRTETTEPSVFTQSDSRGSFRLALAADPTAPAARKILVFQGSKVSGAAFTPTTLAAGKSYNTVYQMIEYIAPPAGILPGGFTVNASGKKVFFSKGNLYWDGTNWGFEDEQHYFRTYEGGGKSDANGYNNASGTASGHWGLFGWSTTESNYGRFALNSYDNYGGTFVDWGKAYCNSNDIDEGTWFTLTGDENGEWGYLFDHHANVWGECNGVPGRFIAPDGFEGDATALSNAIQNWETAQTSGIIFLPAAGYRGNTAVYNTGGYGKYWSASQDGDQKACDVDFGSDYIWSKSSENRFTGYSVRLVTESAGYTPAVKVTGVTISKEETSITVGSKETLAATVAPANATNKQVIWSSSKPSVATVDATSGEVTGVAAGSANIFATTADGNFIAVCLVTVTPKPLPAGALAGKFSVSATKQVNFSKGNLQATYNSSTSKYTWSFAANQYSYVGNAPGNTTIDSPANGAVVDLFGWSTPSTTYGISRSSANDDYSGNFVDWGKAYCESNGIVEEDTWRTLSSAEWVYLLNTRSVNSGVKEGYSYRRATINSDATSVYGLILYPDNYTSQTSAANYTSTEWTTMEQAGCVFLPAAGYRTTVSVYNYGGYGYYWSSTAIDGMTVYSVYFVSSVVNPSKDNYRARGYSVRLVTE